MIDILRYFFGCKHKELGIVQSDGFQYCLDCGQAFYPKKGKCECQLKRIREINHTQNGEAYAITYVLQCKHCGRITKERIE